MLRSELTLTVCIALMNALMSGCIEGARSDGALSQDVPTIHFELARVVSGHDLVVGYIGALTADDEDRIFVLDTEPLSRRVLVVEADGELSNEIGRPGEGPGEFSNLRHALTWSDGALLVLDPRSRRITSFDLNGTVLHTVPWPQERRIFPAKLMGEEPYLYGMEVRQLVPGRQEVTQYATEAQYTRISSSGAVESLPALTEVLSIRSGTDCATPDGRFIHPLLVPFTNPERLRAVLPDGRLVRASTEQFEIEFLDPGTGSATSSISIDLPPRPLEDADWRRSSEGTWITQYEQDGGGTLVDPRNREQPCELYSLLPAYAPAIVSVTLDDQARLWVEGSAESSEGRTTMRVFDTDGTLLATGTMPERDARVAAFINADKLYTATVDQLGVQSIEVHQIVFRP